MCQESRCLSRHAPSKSGPLGHIRSYHRYRNPIEAQPIPRLNEEQPTQDADPRKILSYVFPKRSVSGVRSADTDMNTGREHEHMDKAKD